MTCEPVYLDCRVQGSLLPDTRVTFTDDDVALDLTSYTSWSVQAAPAGSTVSLWSKTAGITAVSTELVIGWLAGDLGALYPGDWRLEVDGTLGGKVRKAILMLTITPENT